jgi:hypothetical protein
MTSAPLPFKVIFVTGCMRSGTSLLHRLISTSPDTGERVAPARYLADFLLLSRSYMNGDSAFAADYFQSRDHLMETTGQFVRDRLADAWANSGKPACLAVRTVEIAPMLPLVATLLPEAKFAVSVREPKDVIASILKVGEKQLKLGRDTPATRRDVWRLARSYNRSYLAAYRAQLGDEQLRRRIVFVRYEDATADPSGALRDVWRRFELAPGTGELKADPDLRPSLKEILVHRLWRAYRTDLSEAAVSTRSVGSHKKALTVAEVLLTNWRCRILRRVFGYSGREARAVGAADVASRGSPFAEFDERP